jgi:hypothetical protein
MIPDDLPLAVLRDVEAPPGGWRYTVPETGVTITGAFFEETWRKVVRHHAANGLPEPSRERVEDQSCRESSGVGTRCGPVKPKPVAGMLPHLTLGLVERFLKTVWETLKARDFVSLEEAERRAEICRSCPLATGGIGGCEGCFSLIRKAKDFVGTSPIKFEENKDACGACGCFLPAKILISNKTLDKAEGEQRPRYWEKCWRLEK